MTAIYRLEIVDSLVSELCYIPLSCEYQCELLIRKATFCQKVTVRRDGNPLHKQSEKAYMCFKMRRVSIREYTIC